MADSGRINSGSTADAELQLTLLGGALLRRNGVVVSGAAAQRHPVALLALLASAPAHTLSRGKLVGYLWPESDERTARNRLTTCVHNVRSRLGDGLVVTAGSDLRLDAAALRCDLLELEAALAAGALERAVALYGGPFLDGFSLPASQEFEEWMERERDRLRRAHADALARLADAAERHGDVEGAVRRWRALVALDPYDSRPTLRLMTALAAAGSTAGALRVLQAHAQRLREELGTEPDPELVALGERLRVAPRAGAAPDGPAGGDARRRLAVLPFETVGREAMPGFTDGVHGDLLTRLSSIGSVAVISRASVMRYRARPTPAGTIGRELGARWILQGEVQSVGRQVCVQARLVDTRDDRQLWGESYRSACTADELFDVQGRIAARIAEALEARLTPAEERAVARRPTSHLESHLLYTQGRGHLDERTEAGFRQAVDYFDRAIARDPEFALAWSGLADVLALLDFYDYAVPASAPTPMAAARRALALDPASGEAHASLGILHSLRQEGAQACRALERAIALQPSHGEAYVWLGWVLLLMGRAAEALSPARRAVEIDPLAPAYRVYLAECWLANGEGERALHEATRATQIQPAYGLAHFMRALVLHHLGRLDEAGAALAETLPRVRVGGSPTHAEVHALQAVVAAAAGDRAAAQALLARVEAVGDEEADPFSVGLVHAALGDADAAFAALARVREWKAFAVEYVRYFFPDVLGPLRRDPRFAEVLARVEATWAEERGEQDPPG